MEAILAPYPVRSTEWLVCHPKTCELWPAVLLSFFNCNCRKELQLKDAIQENMLAIHAMVAELVRSRFTVAASVTSRSQPRTTCKSMFAMEWRPLHAGVHATCNWMGLEVKLLPFQTCGEHDAQTPAPLLVLSQVSLQFVKEIVLWVWFLVDLTGL